MERISRIAHARPGVRPVLLALLCALLLPGTGIAADIPGLDRNETKNVELVVKNLDDLVKAADDVIQKEKGAAVWVPSGPRKKRVAVFEDVDDYKAVLANLKKKLAGKNLHSIPGLSEKTPPKYSLGDPNEKGVKPGHPRAAYCIAHTFVKIGGAWVPCPERDIIVDKPILDPPGENGQPIDETTDQGWKDKWTLLHVLVHEKWHERMSDEQTKLAVDDNKKPGRTEAQKKQNLEEADKKSGSPEVHEEVYEAQKKVLYLKWEVLRRRLKTAAAADKKKIEAQMKWILDEVDRLETSMKKALKDRSEFEFASCGGAGEMKDGTLAIYVLLGNGYWRLDVDLAGGRATDYRVPEFLFWGTRHFEDAVPREPSLYVAMPQRVYTGLRVQAEPCRFLQGAEQAGLVHRGPTFGSIADEVPSTGEDAGGAGETSSSIVGVVLPSDARPGETVSGSVTTDPRAWDDVPAVRVVTVRLPLPRGDAGEPVIDRVTVDAGGGEQPAGGPVTLRLPGNAARIPVRVIARTGPSPIEERQEIQIPGAAPRAPSETQPGEWRAPSICVLGLLQAIWGPLGGDASRTRVDVDTIPARIIAETPRAVYWLLPERTTPGRHRVVVREENRSASFDVFVMALEMSADQLSLVRGQSTRYHVRLRVGNVPPAAWRSAFVPPDLVDPAAVARTAPGTSLPRTDQPGEVLMVLTNGSPGTVTVPDMPGNRRVFHLGERDFKDGVFSHDGGIQSVASGGFVINGLVVAALAAVPGVPGPQDQNVSDTPEARRIRIAYERLQRARSAYQRAIEKTQAELEKGKKSAPKEAVEASEKATTESHKYWHTLVSVSAKYDADKTPENKKALDDAEQKMKDLDEAARDAKQKMIDAMSKEARKAYYDAEDAERQAGHELSEAQKELNAATTK